nr:hypothetical protein [Clostridia bacterium]
VKCSVCGEILTEQEEIPAAGHSFGEWAVVTPASILEEGLEERVCTVCGEKESRELAKLEIAVTVTDESGEAAVSYAAGAFPEGTELAVAAEGSGELACAAYGLLPKNDLKIVTVAAYPAGAGESTEPIQGDAVLTVDVPEGFDESALAVYEITEDGLVELEFTVKDGKVTFRCGSGAYVIADKTEKYENDFLEGDLDGDGQVSAADARLALRASVGLEENTARQNAACDVNLDTEVTPADARLILRKVVGLEEALPVKEA